MGTSFGSLIEGTTISLQDLRNKTLSVDAFNMLYQFLTTIRQYDGTPLKDDKGHITSHLSGLYFRMTKLLHLGVTPVFVFDGDSPDLKKEEQQVRRKRKEQAREKYEEAREKDDVEAMKKYASRTAYLTEEMIMESKELLAALGIAVVQAPGEGEAQAAHMVINGKAEGMISQDTDALMFGCPTIYRNISINQRRRYKSTTKVVEPEMIELDAALNQLGIDREQLIVLGMLCGTDYNRGGIKGIGPSRGIKLVKKHGKDFEALFKEAGWQDSFSYPWKRVFDLFIKPRTTDAQVDRSDLDASKVMEIMVERHGFSRDRIEKGLDRLEKKQAQKGLGDFF